MVILVTLFYVVIGAWVSIVDIKERLIPDRLLLPSILIIHGLVVIGTATTSDLNKLLNSVLGTVVMFSVFFLLAVLSRGALGGGDVKFAAFIGPVLGFYGGMYSVLISLILIFLIGAIVAIVVVLVTKSRKGFIPFAPIMFVGSLFGAIATYN